MDPEDMFADRWEPGDAVHATTAGADNYELSMVPERLTMDFPVQIAVFVYAYAKLRMLQFRYDLLGQYVDHRRWEPLYMDTDSCYLNLGRDNLHDCLRLECKRAFYEHFHEGFPSKACDAHRAKFMDIMTRLGPRALYPALECCKAHRVYDEKMHGLFKTEWDGYGMVALSSKTCYCRDSQGQDKLSSKGLQKKANADSLTYETYRRVLSTGLLGGGVNHGIRVGLDGQMYTYR